MTEADADAFLPARVASAPAAGDAGRDLHARAFGRACGFIAVAACLALPMALASRDAGARSSSAAPTRAGAAAPVSAFGASAPLTRPEALRAARVCAAGSF